MHFIRIGKSFIHLDEVKAITVDSIHESEITVTATYKDDTTMTIHLDTYYDQLDKPTISPEAIAMSIQDAIECVGNCDCANVDNYIEDNIEILEDADYD